MPPIQFRCIRCQHPVEAPKDAVGRKMYCPACYLELRVPAESTVRDVSPDQLYDSDAVPMDVRGMTERLSRASVRCSVCHTNISVSREQAGTEVVCPECETKVPVPKDIVEKIDHAVQTGGGRLPSNSVETVSGETYGVQSNGQPTVDRSRAAQVYCPVYCKLCGTRMHASEDQIGQELTCPDCETKTVVPPRPQTIPKPPPLPNSFEGGSTFGVSGEPPASTEPEGTGRLVPVVCKLCKTRMYGRESAIGGFKTCPDCGVQTEIKAVPESQMSEPEPIADGAYDVSEPTEPKKRPSIRTLTDYRYIDGSLDREHYPDEPTPSEDGYLWDVTGKRTQYADDLNAAEFAQRRALRMAGVTEDDDSVQPMQRPKLPKYPFWTRIFACFKSGPLWGRIIVALLLAVAGYVLGSLLPGLFFVVSAPFGVFTLALGVGLMVNTLHSVFLWTTVGNDIPTRDDWMEYRFVDSTMFAVWLFFVVVFASAPGYLLYTSLSTVDPKQPDVPLFLSCVIPSAWFFFPILFLSSMEAGSYFMLLARETCLSLLYRTGVWLRFYFLTALMAIAFLTFDYLMTFVTQNVFAFFFLTLPVFTFFSLWYFRLLGRLGWALEELARQDAAEEEE